MAAAIAARRTGTPLFHFEAGIRTGDNTMPEEINRIITDRLADTNYCCTFQNYQVMLAEGYGNAINNRLVQSGDLMFDAFLKIPFAENKVVNRKELCSLYDTPGRQYLIKRKIDQHYCCVKCPSQRNTSCTSPPPAYAKKNNGIWIAAFLYHFIASWVS